MYRGLLSIPVTSDALRIRAGADAFSIFNTRTTGSNTVLSLFCGATETMFLRRDGVLILTGDPSVPAIIGGASQFRSGSVVLGFNLNGGTGVAFCADSFGANSNAGANITGLILGSAGRLRWTTGALANSTDVELYRDLSGGLRRVMALFPSGPAQQVAIEGGKQDFSAVFYAVAGATSLFTNGQAGVTFNAGGTASGISVDNTDYGKWPKIRYTSAATAGSFQNLRTAGNGAVVSRQNGFEFDCIWGHCDAAAVADARSFCGIRGNIGDVGNVNPSTLTLIAGVGNDSGEANLQLMYNDGTGTATKVDLGANFPANTLAADMYRLQLWGAPNEAQINYRLTRLNTGQVASGSINTDIPPLTTMLGFTLFRGNGATALAVRYDIVELTLSPRSLI